jgi:2'-5' RNA ligase
VTEGARYAIYLAPPPDSDLWRVGSHVLGYDAASGAELPGFAAAGFDADSWFQLTARPRAYGFHATLKAPFRLRQAETSADLRQSLAAYASTRPTFDAGPLAVTSVGEQGHGFVALTPQRHSAELMRLEAETVASFERFRAPATAAEIAARQPDRLTQRQRDNLALWGYPFVGPDFHPHMTLTGATPQAAEIADALADIFANRVGAAHLVVGALTLFEQPGPGERFRITGRFPLAPAEDLRDPEGAINSDPFQGAPQAG